jgi:ATP-binding cassette subfamily B protein
MTEQKSDFTVIKRLIKQAIPYWGYIVCIFLLSLLAAPLALLVPVPMKIVVDNVIGTEAISGLIGHFIPDAFVSSKYSLLLFAVIMQTSIVLLIQLQSLITYVLQTYVGERLTLSFRKRLFSHIQRLSFAFHDKRGTADSIYRIQYDTPSLQNIALYGIMPLLSSVLTLLGMVYVILSLNAQLALVAFTVMPLVVLLSRLYSVRMRPYYARLKQTQSQVLGIIQEVLTAFRVVKAFGREDTENERFEQHSCDAINQRIWMSFAEGAFGLVTKLLTAIGMALVLYIGVRNILAGTLTLGELLMVITYLSQLYGPLHDVVSKVVGLQSSLVSAHRAFELIDEVPDVLEHPDAKKIDRALGNVEYRNVSFSYDGKNDVLHGISLTAKAGSRIGIAGKTGAGKSTLVSLMPRFYDPGKGSILIDDIDIREYKIADLRNQFAIVLQEPVLFATSIRENILYAKPEADEEEIIEAAKAANAHEFITALPEGYDTVVGERGMRLSGGERQRISLARAFLKNAPILILDEPTSSIDTTTEALIMNAMEQLMKNRTTFMIAHRLSTLEKCDHRIEIHDGRIRPAIAGNQNS